MPTPSQERRDRERVELRGKILDAARELFANEGYEAVTMRKVAERVAYSPTALYFHFADKLTLVRELVREDFRALAAHFNAIDRVADPMERLLRLGEGYLGFALQFPNHYRMMFMTPLPPEAEPRHDLEAMADKGIPERDAYARLRQLTQEALDAGCFRPDLTDVDFIAQLLWSSVHGVAALQICMKGEGEWVEMRSPLALAQESMNGVMAGIAHPDRPWLRRAEGSPSSKPSSLKSVKSKPSRPRS